MTSLALLLWIALGIAVQLALYLGIGFWRHWQRYQTLQESAAEYNLSVPQESGAASLDKTPPAAWTDYRPFKVERKVIEDEAGAICSFYLVPEDKKPLPAFLPGQFLTFKFDIPSATPSGQLVRCYSLSDAPRPDGYRISVKRALPPKDCAVPAGRSSSHLHDHIEIGSRLQVRAPSGHFHIDRSDAPVVLIGGGIGITPMLSMLNWIVNEQPGREVWLFYGVRNSRELVMKSHLARLADAHPNFHLRLCFSNPLPEEKVGRDYHFGARIDVRLLRSELPLKPFHFYICGPTPMLESLVPGLEDWGVPEAHIHFEAFGPASIKRKPAAQPPAVAAESDIVVTFARSGKQLPWQPAAGNLLDFAEANGIAVDSGCRAGGCGSCQTTIKSGEVSYPQAPEFDPEPGSCLLCTCIPKTSVTLEV